MSEEQPWDEATAIPTPVSDLVQEISKRLSKICLREGGLLDIETDNNPGKGKITDNIKHTAELLKAATIRLHNQVSEQAP